MKTNDYYSTSDLPLVATLALWFPIDCIDRSNSSKAVFYFQREAGLETLIESYWKRALQVEPQSYFAQLKIIKSRLYENK